MHLYTCTLICEYVYLLPFVNATHQFFNEVNVLFGETILSEVALDTRMPIQHVAKQSDWKLLMLKHYHQETLLPNKISKNCHVIFLTVISLVGLTCGINRSWNKWEKGPCPTGRQVWIEYESAHECSNIVCIVYINTCTHVMAKSSNLDAQNFLRGDSKLRLSGLQALNKHTSKMTYSV